MNPPNDKIFHKKIAEKWLQNVLQKEYSITVHPQGTKMPRKLLRKLKDKGFSCTLKDEKMVVTSNDALAIGQLIKELKTYGFFVEED
jgi:SOS response regulatory protein OraA/RecX